MNLDNYNKEKYGHGVLSLNKNTKLIFVEGNNKLFYSQFEEIKHIPIFRPLDVKDIIVEHDEHNSFSSDCNNIKKIVSLNSNWHAILDKDFNFDCFSTNRIYYINYYSLENIVLIYHRDFLDLKNIFSSFIDELSLDCYKNNKYKLTHPCYEKSLDELQFSATLIHEQHKQYLDLTIIDCKTYLQFMPVKNIIEKFDGWLKKNKENFKGRNYFNTLYEELQAKNLMQLSLLFVPACNENSNHYTEFYKLYRFESQ